MALTGMVSIPGGEFGMGSDSHYPEETPHRQVNVAPFLIDRHPVTNSQFSEFVSATGYVTVAERPLSEQEYPHLSAVERAPGSVTFQPTNSPVDLRNWRQWWRWTTGASWRQPFGPESNIDGWGDHPVVQVCVVDAQAYASWTGRRLPTEAEWERAARGGLVGQDFAWGSELMPGGQLMANTWQGSFPYRNTGALGWQGTSPVMSFAPNGYGLFDMIGNVWEWTKSLFDPVPQQGAQPSECGCSPAKIGPTAYASAEPDPSIRRVTKGGSHLCAPEYCRRYRPAARAPQTEDSATTHLGFRCASDE